MLGVGERGEGEEKRSGGGGGGGGGTSAGGGGEKRSPGGEERKAEPPPAGGCSVGLKTVRYSSFSISVLEYIPVCFCWFNFLVKFHVPSRVCIDSLFESLFWRMSVLYLLVKFFDFFSWFTAVIFFFQRLYD